MTSGDTNTGDYDKLFIAPDDLIQSNQHILLEIKVIFFR